MTFDWKHIPQPKDFSLTHDGIKVRFLGGRTQTVRVDPQDGGEIRIWSIVGKPGILRKVKDLELRAWLRNRHTEMIGFRVDERFGLIGEAFVPVFGLLPDEWALYVHALAQHCDWFEFRLTGKDRD